MRAEFRDSLLLDLDYERHFTALSNRLDQSLKRQGIVAMCSRRQARTRNVSLWMAGRHQADSSPYRLARYREIGNYNLKFDELFGWDRDDVVRNKGASLMTQRRNRHDGVGTPFLGNIRRNHAFLAAARDGRADDGYAQQRNGARE